MAPTNWICIKCGVTNPKKFLKCQTCEEPKAIFWECACKRKNATGALKCAGCKRHRPAIYGATVAMKGLWAVKFASQKDGTAEGEDSLKGNLGSKSDSLSGALPVSPVASSFQASPGSNIDSVITVSSTISGKYPSALSKCTLDYNVSYYDIFKKLSQPSRTSRQVNYVDDETKLQQIIAQCVQGNTTYIDPQFPPTTRTLYYNSEQYKQIIEKDKTAKVYWLRHRHTRPIDKESRALNWCVTRHPVVNDITQGVLGNCWLLTALAVLVERPDLLDKILATKELSQRGAYRLRLYREGRLTSIIVDDYFPCNSNRFHIYSSAKRKQLFVSLIEKGMAKLYGCYESLVSGQVIEGLAALTGFPCRSVRIHAITQQEKAVTASSTDFNEDNTSKGGGTSGGKDDDAAFDRDLLWTMLLSYYTAGFLMGAACGSVLKNEIPEGGSGATTLPTPGDDEDFTKVGLLNHHAYSIVSVVHVDSGDLRLMRLRNPWGTLVWNGDWSDESSLWTPELREQLKPEAASEGMFWMSFDDFHRYFEKVDVCKLRDTWSEARFEGYFPKDCKDNRFTCVFQLVVEDAGTEVELTLYQDSRRMVMLKQAPLIPIGLAVFQMQDLQCKLAGHFVDTSGYKMRQFVACDLMLDKGLYLVAVYAFNHWIYAAQTAEISNPDRKTQLLIRSGLHIRPRYTLSAHFSRAVQLSAFCIAPSIIGDSLIEIVLAKGRKKDHNENVTSYYVHENWAGLMAVIENRNKDCCLDVLFDASESFNLATTRGALLTQDTIPPSSRQLINILSHLDSSTSFYLSYQLSYRVSNQSASVHTPDISSVKSLHSPRPFKQISEQQAAKPVKAIGGFEQQLKAMVEQQKKAGQFGMPPKIPAFGAKNQSPLVLQSPQTQKTQLVQQPQSKTQAPSQAMPQTKTQTVQQATPQFKVPCQQQQPQLSFKSQPQAKFVSQLVPESKSKSGSQPQPPQQQYRTQTKLPAQAQAPASTSPMPSQQQQQPAKSSESQYWQALPAVSPGAKYQGYQVANQSSPNSMSPLPRSSASCQASSQSKQEVRAPPAGQSSQQQQQQQPVAPMSAQQQQQQQQWKQNPPPQ